MELHVLQQADEDMHLTFLQYVFQTFIIAVFLYRINIRTIEYL